MANVSQMEQIASVSPIRAAILGAAVTVLALIGNPGDRFHHRLREL